MVRVILNTCNTGAARNSGLSHLGTVDFHTSEQWTFDIIHCYFRNCKCALQDGKDYDSVALYKLSHAYDILKS